MSSGVDHTTTTVPSNTLDTRPSAIQLLHSARPHLAAIKSLLASVPCTTIQSIQHMAVHDTIVTFEHILFSTCLLAYFTYPVPMDDSTCPTNQKHLHYTRCQYNFTNLKVDDASDDVVHHPQPIIPRILHPLATPLEAFFVLRRHLVQLHRVPARVTDSGYFI